jgi:hypothetical protein
VFLLSACYSCVCSHLADSSPGRRGQSAWSQLAWCSSCSSHVLERLRFDPFGQLFLARRSLADCPLGRRRLSARHQLLTNQARTVHYSRCTSGGSVAFFEMSARGSRTVRSVLADRPPRPRGPSTWAFAELLSLFLLLFLFRFKIVWGLFLVLVGPL